MFGFVLSSILFFKKSTNTKATYILGSFYFILSVYAFQGYIIDGGYLKSWTWFFLWPLLPYHLIFIPIYYYFKVILTDRLTWHNAEILLFIPFILGVIDVTYVYLQPETVFNTIIENAMVSPEKRLKANYLLLTLSQHMLLRHLWQLGVLIVIIPQLRDFLQKAEHDELKAILNKWLLLFWWVTMAMAIFAIVYVCERMLVSTGYHTLIITGIKGSIVTLIFYVAVFLTGVIPLYFPSILHGYPQQVRPISKISIEEPDTDLKFGLDEETVNSKLEGLKACKSYLNTHFGLTECALELDMPAHHISYYLKNQFGLSFAAYRNSLRMDYAKKLIEEGYLENNTIEALAGECGFASRTSFSKVFKNATDVNPSAYALANK